jgi:hypothetical protein
MRCSTCACFAACWARTPVPPMVARVRCWPPQPAPTPPHPPDPGPLSPCPPVCPPLVGSFLPPLVSLRSRAPLASPPLAACLVPLSPLSARSSACRHPPHPPFPHPVACRPLPHHATWCGGVRLVLECALHSAGGCGAACRQPAPAVHGRGACVRARRVWRCAWATPLGWRASPRACPRCSVSDLPPPHRAQSPPACCVLPGARPLPPPRIHSGVQGGDTVRGHRGRPWAGGRADGHASPSSRAARRCPDAAALWPAPPRCWPQGQEHALLAAGRPRAAHTRRTSPRVDTVPTGSPAPREACC